MNNPLPQPDSPAKTELRRHIESIIETTTDEVSTKELIILMNKLEKLFQSNLQAFAEAVRREVIGNNAPVSLFANDASIGTNRRQTANEMRDEQRQHLAAVAKRFGVEG